MLLLYILNQTSIKSLSQDLLQSLKTKKKKNDFVFMDWF